MHPIPGHVYAASTSPGATLDTTVILLPPFVKRLNGLELVRGEWAHRMCWLTLRQLLPHCGHACVILWVLWLSTQVVNCRMRLIRLAFEEMIARGRRVEYF